jgi:hypothetical protein
VPLVVVVVSAFGPAHEQRRRRTVDVVKIAR